jgi:hypothetical protein
MLGLLPDQTRKRFWITLDRSHWRLGKVSIARSSPPCISCHWERCTLNAAGTGASSVRFEIGPKFSGSRGACHTYLV